MNTTYGMRGDPRRALYVLLAGAEGGGPTARAARQAQDKELAEFLRKAQDEVVEKARKLLAERAAEKERETGRAVRVERVFGRWNGNRGLQG